MKFKVKVFFALVAVVLSLAFISCEKDTTTTIYGTVFDDRTGEPVPVAQVAFGPADNSGNIYASAVTGDDGRYEMIVTQNEGTSINRICVEKYGYAGSQQYCEVVLGKGMKYQVDIILHEY